jgi:hypothetical protein
MSPRRWLYLTIALTLAAAAAFAVCNAAYDVYGVFRHTRGRKLAAYGDSRVAKFLLSAHYVPENFNGVLVGTSASANWDVSSVGPYLVYNESVAAGNIVEEKAIVENALRGDRIAVAFLLVQPFLTYSHEFVTVRLAPSLKYSSLGSLSLVDAYRSSFKTRWRGKHPEADWAGTESFDDVTLVLNSVLRKMFAAEEFPVDPEALAAYGDLVAELRARRVQRVFVVPPVYEELLQHKRKAFENYSRRIAAIAAGDPWIDFTSDAFLEFRRDRANFGDGVHLLRPAARRVVEELNRRVADLVRQGRLRLP